MGLEYGAGQFIFSVEKPIDGHRATAGNDVHIAFGVETRDAVDRFHAQALR